MKSSKCTARKKSQTKKEHTKPSHMNGSQISSFFCSRKHSWQASSADLVPEIPHGRVLIPSSFDKEIVSKEIFCNQNYPHTNIHQGIVITSKGNRFRECSFCITQLTNTPPHAYRSTAHCGTEGLLSPILRCTECWVRQDAVLHRPNQNSISKQLVFPLKLEKNPRTQAGVGLTSWKRSWSVWASQLLTTWPSRASLLPC